jgi:hypothetical protein
VVAKNGISIEIILSNDKAPNRTQILLGARYARFEVFSHEMTSRKEEKYGSSILRAVLGRK